jgi:hypothetical protein
MNSSRKDDLEKKLRAATALPAIPLRNLVAATEHAPEYVGARILVHEDTFYLAFIDENVERVRTVKINPVAAVRLANDLSTIAAERFPTLFSSTPETAKGTVH